MVFTDVWCFDEAAITALENMELELEIAKKNEKIEKQFRILLCNSSNLLSKNSHAVQVLMQFIILACVRSLENHRPIH